jgi:hypothetical protein
MLSSSITTLDVVALLLLLVVVKDGLIMLGELPLDCAEMLEPGIARRPD